MDWLQNLLDNSSTPILTAFLLGLLTAISPCPLATNIAAVGFIGRNIENRKRVFINGLLYTLGRVLSYTLLGVVLIMILREGFSMFGIQKTIGTWGEFLIGPMLLIIGLFMIWGDRLNLPKLGFNGNAEGLARKGGVGALLIGVLFALAFCPTSGVFYFGMLIPMSATATAGYLLPAVFAVATAIPVLVVAWILAFSVQQMSSFYGRIKTVQKWLNVIVGILFIVLGIYYCFVMFF
ncbi:aromatic aminobenezylarsenical efflux permease ArsG family transporter [uncultured Bacteroides sp.]|uniref:aromatic aminobenezylarsenical efflux permease ArsG family transporter n=1 Tax=uncultured Bacteroides sp. TaxID=162156 RepID=UPI00261128AD|nr:aromatic aminobenezylarsenical efflux permease ArsG family transporter [uncultured Bacteroides sp.]